MQSAQLRLWVLSQVSDSRERAAAQMGEPLGVRPACLEAIGDGLQEAIGDGAPKRVIDDAQVINIKHRHGKLRRAADSRHQQACDALAEQRSLGQTREGIEIGQEIQLLVSGTAGTANLGVGERALHGGHESLRIGLENVVHGAAEQSVDGPLLADGAGEENEGDVRHSLPGDRERSHAVKSRQTEVREDEAGDPLLQGAAELQLRRYDTVAAVQAALRQALEGELNVGRGVLDQQDIQIRAGRSRVRRRRTHGESLLDNAGLLMGDESISAPGLGLVRGPVGEHGCDGVTVGGAPLRGQRSKPLRLQE